MDKQPPFEGWKEGFHPYKPVVVDGKLYGNNKSYLNISIGRGGADDGYSIFATALAIKACQVHKLKHPRIIMLFEADEESGTGHIDYYIEKLRPRIGNN
jgi:acetylornithine deacetylase/succinyl-diaminopimelate desuccinylase-like protein